MEEDGEQVNMLPPKPAIDRILLSERDFKRVLELLASPPQANAKLRAAIAALPPEALSEASETQGRTDRAEAAPLAVGG